ncbi:MAG: hypothetical protein QXO51_08305 [Halobacteria archaeon]
MPSEPVLATLFEKLPPLLEQVLREFFPDERKFIKSALRVTRQTPPPPEELVRKHGGTPAGQMFLAVFPRLYFLLTHMAAEGVATRRDLEARIRDAKATVVRAEQALYHTRRILASLEQETGVPLSGDFERVAGSLNHASWEAWAVEHVGALLEKGLFKEAEPVDPVAAEKEKEELLDKIRRGDLASREAMKSALQRLVYLCQVTGDPNRIVWEDSLKRLKAPKVSLGQMKVCPSCNSEMERVDAISVELAASEVAFLCPPCGFGRIVWLNMPPEEFVPVVEEGAEAGRRILKFKARKAQERRMLEEAAKALGAAREKLRQNEESGAR